eukprot:COSAG02_NODE_28468_length_589_cov_0.710204_1_plen_121_part_10
MGQGALRVHQDQVYQMQTDLAVSHALPANHPQMMVSAARPVLTAVCIATARQGAARPVVLVRSQTTTALPALYVLLVQLALVALARTVNLARNQMTTRLVVSRARRVQRVLPGIRVRCVPL